MKIDFNDFTDQELRETVINIKTELGDRKEKNLESNRKLKEQRKEEFKNKINIDDVVKFLFNRTECEGIVLSANKSTCKISFNDAEKRIDYCNIIKILESEDQEDQEDQDDQEDQEDLEDQDLKNAI